MCGTEAKVVREDRKDYVEDCVDLFFMPHFYFYGLYVFIIYGHISTATIRQYDIRSVTFKN